MGQILPQTGAKATAAPTPSVSLIATTDDAVVALAEILLFGPAKPDRIAALETWIKGKKKV
jgi:hypothetical protein